MPQDILRRFYNLLSLAMGEFPRDRAELVNLMMDYRCPERIDNDRHLQREDIEEMLDKTPMELFK